MSRDIEPIERANLQRTEYIRTVEPNADTKEIRTPSRERAPFIGRTYAYQISPAELETMYDIGRFRTVAIEDLVSQRYRGNTGQMREDLRSLLNQGLLTKRTLWAAEGRQKVTLLALNKAGKEMLERGRPMDKDQQVYSGFVKPAEVRHDAAIYRMFQAECRQIEAAGGKVHRVVLDYELKRKAYAPLAKARTLPALEYTRRQAEVARENGLKVVQGKIQLPDLRIEYQTKDGEMARVDLELATHHYHGSHLQAKAAAGFKMYAPAGSAGALKSMLEERDIIAEILSL